MWIRFSFEIRQREKFFFGLAMWISVIINLENNNDQTHDESISCYTMDPGTPSSYPKTTLSKLLKKKLSKKSKPILCNALKLHKATKKKTFLSLPKTFTCVKRLFSGNFTSEFATKFMNQSPISSIFFVPQFDFTINHPSSHTKIIRNEFSKQ